MLELQQNRYLWVHLVALAAVPLLLDICWIGLASAGPILPGSLAFWAIALLGIGPSLWMQLAKPFYVFSLPPLALRPSALSDDQRRCLRLLKSWQIKMLAALAALLALWTLWQLAARSPQITPMLPAQVGLISAAVSFFWACVFLQVSISAGRSLLVGPATLKRVAPYEVSAIATDFLMVGVRVEKIGSLAESAPESSAEASDL
jgi:hypothetical protein